MLPGKLPDSDGVERFRITQERSRSIGREEPADATLRVDESHLQIQTKERTGTFIKSCSDAILIINNAL